MSYQIEKNSKCWHIIGIIGLLKRNMITLQGLKEYDWSKYKKEDKDLNNIILSNDYSTLDKLNENIFLISDFYTYSSTNYIKDFWNYKLEEVPYFNKVIYPVLDWTKTLKNKSLYNELKSCVQKDTKDKVVIIIKNIDTKKFLIIEESLWDSQNTFGFVKGGIKEGEEVIHAVEREIYEEIGITYEDLIAPPKIFIVNNKTNKLHVYLFCVNTFVQNYITPKIQNYINSFKERINKLQNKNILNDIQVIKKNVSNKVINLDKNYLDIYHHLDYINEYRYLTGEVKNIFWSDLSEKRNYNKVFRTISSLPHILNYC